MIDTTTGETIWSCSLTCFQYKHEGKIEEFFEKAIAVCLDTIPAL
jgi:hypothetical protein